MMISYVAGTPQFDMVSDWFRVDPGAESHPVYPNLVNSDYTKSINSLHLETLETPLGSEHYFITKYRRTTGASVYRKYKVPDCW